jgi:hypothetical protein
MPVPLSRERSPRSAAKISQRLDVALNGYTVAALATGIGIMGFSAPAAGKIVYTPTHKTIFPNKTLFIDLNNDGTPDFSIIDRASQGGTSHNKFYNGDVLLSGLGISDLFAQTDQSGRFPMDYSG